MSIYDDHEYTSRIYVEGTSERIEDNRREDIKLLESLSLVESGHSLKWTDRVPLNSKYINVACPGVYLIEHVPSDQAAYYGVAEVLSARVNSHVRAFRNEGYADKTKPSIVASKMLNMDPCEDNWSVRFLKCFSKGQAEKIEKLYGIQNPSLFNDLKMLGK